MSKETRIGESVINKILSGHEFDVENVDAITRLFARQFPIDKKHLLVNHDTSSGGMWHMSRDETEKSARVFDRTNSNGDTTPYYRYMDTAASSLAPFKPELIEMLVEVKNNDAMNPLVVMNRGHLLAQQTFFIGPVNYYCTLRGKRVCVPMNTGDSCIITPYVPHSFTSRDSSKYSAIVAVTFSTSVRDALADLVHQDTTRLLSCAGDMRNPSSVRDMRIKRFCELRGLSVNTLMDEVKNFKSSKKRGRDDAKESEDEESLMLAAKLNVPPSALKVSELQENQEVQYAFGSKIPDAKKDENLKKPLASAMHMFEVGGYEWQISKPNSILDCQMFNYIYNHGSVSVHIMTATKPFAHSCALAPGDSIVLKPFVKCFVSPVKAMDSDDDNNLAKLVIVKVPGCVGLNVVNEIATFANEGRSRMTTNVEKWF